MGRTACTEPQCLYKGALYLLPISKHRDHPTFLSHRGTNVFCTLEVIFTRSVVIYEIHQKGRNFRKDTWLICELSLYVCLSCDHWSWSLITLRGIRCSVQRQMFILSGCSENTAASCLLQGRYTICRSVLVCWICSTMSEWSTLRTVPPVDTQIPSKNQHRVSTCHSLLILLLLFPQVKIFRNAERRHIFRSIMKCAIMRDFFLPPPCERHLHYSGT
jgi:hypothetical protein